MGPIENLTPYGFGFLPNVDRRGDEVMIVALAAHFALPQPGRMHAGPLTPCEDQPPPHFDDVYWGDPGSTSLRMEGQSAFTRPGTDIYVNGSAHAPGGRPVEAMDVDVAVGPCRVRARVFGDRVWVRAGPALQMSAPVPFTRVPLLWERAFGGGDVGAGNRGYEPRNPVGVGVVTSSDAPEHADGVRLPNIEHPDELVREPWARPTPVGFGAIGRHWWPRSSFAGTYDQAWIEQRAPLWPDDLDDRFFVAAAPGLCAIPHLRGGESVALSGLHPEGGFGFRLPTLRVSCKSVFDDRTVRHALRMDAVCIEADEGRITLILRAAVELGRGLDHRYTIVRALEDWEPLPELAPTQLGQLGRAGR